MEKKPNIGYLNIIDEKNVKISVTWNKFWFY